MRLLHLLDALPTRRVLYGWLGLVLVSALAYWLLGSVPGHGLSDAGEPLGTGALDLLRALYFSLVTVTSVGYGDVLPHGLARALSMTEAILGLLLFGVLVARLVSWRQEALVMDIHRLTFEARLERVQTNLHLMIADLQSIVVLTEGDAHAPARLSSRIESATMVFSTELRTVHELLERPRGELETPVLEGILASLSAALEELAEIVQHAPAAELERPRLRANLECVARTAGDICADCIPGDLAPELTVWMDRVSAQAARVAPKQDPDPRGAGRPPGSVVPTSRQDPPR